MMLRRNLGRWRRVGGRQRLEWLAREAADWRLPPRDFPGTRYMAKAEKAGRRVAWLRFRDVMGGGMCKSTCQTGAGLL